MHFQHPSLSCIGLVVIALPVAAQTPNVPSSTDANRQPAIAGQRSTFDDNRIPALQGAGSIGTIPSFGSGGAIVPQFPQTAAPTAPYQSPLSPYLNLVRNQFGGGISAIDYFNFVLPAQQGPGSYFGQPYSSFAAPSQQRRGFGGYFDPDAPFEPQAIASPSGAGPATFLNYGGYFNRYGTIGTGRQQGAPNVRRR